MNTASETPFEFSVVAGDPTPEELAAVTAVLTAVIAEQGEQDRRRRAHPGPDAWQRSQRRLRSPLHPGYGAWRGFGG